MSSGWRPATLVSHEHQDPFQPALFFSAIGAEGWTSFEGSSDACLALSAGGTLLSNSQMIASPAETQRWSQVAAGRSSYFAIAADGDLYLNGSLVVRKPALLTRWSEVAASDSFLLALGSNDEAYLLNPDGALLGAISRPGRGTTWTRVEAAATSALLLGSNGEVYAINLDPEADVNSLLPIRQNRPPGVTSWTDFAAGGHHYLFLADTGELYSSGRNVEGQLGIGRTSSSEGLKRVPFPRGVSRWTQIAAGEYHSLAVGDDCHVYAWGSNEEGQLGLGRHIATQNRPARIGGLRGFCFPAPEIRALTQQANGDVLLRFETILNRGTFVEYSDDLVTWRRINEAIPGDSLEASWTDAGAPLTVRHPRDSARRFYRVVRE